MKFVECLDTNLDTLHLFVSVVSALLVILCPLLFSWNCSSTAPILEKNLPMNKKQKKIFYMIKSRKCVKKLFCNTVNKIFGNNQY